VTLSTVRLLIAPGTEIQNYKTIIPKTKSATVEIWR
jgi:hypothetical protein